MQPGPKPKPSALKRRQGNPGKRPLPVEPRLAPLDQAPEPPEDLTEIGASAWKDLAGALANAGILQEQFLPLLRMYAHSVELAEQARKALEGKPLTRQGRGGGVNPDFRVWRDAVSAARSLAEQLGASPVAMTRLATGQIQGLSLQEELKRKYASRPA